MDKGRLEAFTDGVIAVIITVMVLELRPPSSSTWAALLGEWSAFLSYILSFVYVGIYWNNHHHMLKLVKSINGEVLWSNLLFLFCLSMFPFSTAWLNQGNPRPAQVPTIFYGVTLLMTAMSWEHLSQVLIKANGGSNRELREAFGTDRKTKASICIHIVAIACAFYRPAASCVLYAAVAAIWFVPDKRIERRLGSG